MFLEKTILDVGCRFLNDIKLQKKKDKNTNNFKLIINKEKKKENPYLFCQLGKEVNNLIFKA